MKTEIGKRLKSLRLEKGLTQKELASRIRGGIDYTYVGKIERGEQLPSLKILLKISEALSAPASYFLQNDALPAVKEIPAPESMLLVREKIGRDLFCTLKFLNEDDIPLVTEFARLLIRHKSVARRKLSGPLRDGVLLAAEEAVLYGKE